MKFWLAFSAMLFFVVGCGVQFKGAGDARLGGAQVKALLALPRTVAKNDLGELQLVPATDDQDSHDLVFIFKIPYARLYQNTALALHAKSLSACQGIGGIAVDRPENYAPGDLPCGIGPESEDRQLQTLHLKSQAFRSGDFWVELPPQDLPISLGREHFVGSYEELNIETKTSEVRSSARSFDLGVFSSRLGIEEQGASFQICENNPGSDVLTPTTEVEVSITSLTQTPPQTVALPLTAQWGRGHFDFGRSCQLARLSWADAEGIQVVRAAATSPGLSGASTQGLFVRSGLPNAEGLIGDITSAWNSEIYRRLNEKPERPDKGEQPDLVPIASGDWLLDLQTRPFLARTNSMTMTAFLKILRRTSLPFSSIDLAVELEDQCRLLRLSQSPQYRDRVRELCEGGFADLKMKTARIEADEQERQMGCFDFFARTPDLFRQKKNPWWSDACHLQERMMITLPAAMADDQPELQLLFENFLKRDNYPETWIKRGTELGLDPYSFAILLQEWEARGYQTVSDQDWEARIPDLIHELRDTGRI